MVLAASSSLSAAIASPSASVIRARLSRSASACAAIDRFISSLSSTSLSSVSYTHLRAHETDSYLVCRLLLEKKKKKKNIKKKKKKKKKNKNKKKQKKKN